MLGCERHLVRLVPYQPAWAELFKQEAEALRNALGDHVVRVEHVGSTAVPGLAAKPIIDIAVAIESFEGAAACVGRMEQIGYEHKGEHGIPRRRFFVKRDPDTTHHVHMNEPGSRDWENLILFRDYLLEHPAAAEEYAALKLKLARRFPHDILGYRAGKADFITAAIQEAKKWGAEQVRP